MFAPVILDLDEEYQNALNKEADKESRLYSISHLNFMYPLDDLVLDDAEDADIRIAALECLDLSRTTLFDIDIDKLPEDLALAVIEKYYFEDKLKNIALNHPKIEYRIKAVENKHLKDENALKYLIENESDSMLRSAAARNPSLNDSRFLESIALNDSDKYLRQAAVSNYSTKDIPTLKRIIKDDKEDMVRISALENLIFKYNLFYPCTNRKFNFKRKFDEIASFIIRADEKYIPKEMNDDDRINDLIDFDLLNKIYVSSVNEEYDKLRENLIYYLENILFYFEKYNVFNQKDEDGSYKKEVYDEFDLLYGDNRALMIYKTNYEYWANDLKRICNDLKTIRIDLEDFEESEGSSKFLPLNESYFIDLAYGDSNCSIVRLAIEAISDNFVLEDFIKNGKSKDIRKTAIKKSTDSSLLVDIGINRFDNDIRETNFLDEEWICDYVSNHLDDFSNAFNPYGFYDHDLEYYERSFDNRLNSFYYDEIAELYYRNTLSYCLFKKIRNFFDLIHVLKKTRSFALRDLIIYKIDNPVVLADIALNAIDEGIRYIAFGRIDSKAVLNYVYSKTEDFRIKYLYLSKIDDNSILEEAFFNEANDVLLKSILDNRHFRISPKIIDYCINQDSFIASYAENKFANHFANFRLMEKKFKN